LAAARQELLTADGVKRALLLQAVDYDHPDAVRLIAQVQAVYQERYGGVDATPLDPAEFAAPLGFFVIGYLDGCSRGATAVACGGWRARDAVDGDPELRAGDAEIKRMFVVAGYRGRGFARAVLAELERTAAAAGRRRAVLETGVRQPEAIALYASAGYVPIAKFGTYRQEPGSRCFGKSVTPVARVDAR
jgi:ribosomal protein S18 acetylase RimI-like enzyme